MAGCSYSEALWQAQLAFHFHFSLIFLHCLVFRSSIGISLSLFLDFSALSCFSQELSYKIIWHFIFTFPWFFSIFLFLFSTQRLNWHFTFTFPWFSALSCFSQELSYKLNWNFTLTFPWFSALSCFSQELSYKLNWHFTFTFPWFSTLSCFLLLPRSSLTSSISLFLYFSALFCFSPGIVIQTQLAKLEAPIYLSL